MNIEDRHLNFNNFINQRAQQILKFTQALQIDTRKKGHQGVPKSLRRRAMSHNRYRIPLKIRKSLNEELAKAQSMQKLPKCRKSIRKKHRLLLSYKMRSNKCRWLPTHLWATKRMRMIDYFNYKIGYTPNDKSFRSGYRHFRHNACLLDFSYLQCLCFKILNNSIPSCLEFQQKLNSLLQIVYDRFYYGRILSSGRLVCPTFVIRKNREYLYCFFDPCCASEIESLTREINNQHLQVVMRKSPIQIYMLLGPNSIIRVHQLLQKLNISIEQLTTMTNISRPHYYPHNRLFYHTGQQKSPNKQPNISKPFQPSIKQGYNPQSNKLLREQFNLLLHSYSPKTDESNQKNSQIFWNFYNQQQLQLDQQGLIAEDLMIKLTNRSKYTHKRKNKLTKQEKKKLLQEQNQRRKADKLQEKPKQMVNQDNQIQLRKQLFRKPTLKQNLSPLAIGVINAYDNYFVPAGATNFPVQGCFILCYSDKNCLVWRTLTHLNVKVLGQRQYKHFLMESGMQAFPQDAFGTQSFQQHWKTKSVKAIIKYKRLPPQKRINHHKILSPFPFYIPIDYKTNCNTRFVSIEMVGRGKCYTGSYICQLENEDYMKIEEYLATGAPIKHITKQNAPITDKLPEQPNFKQDCPQIINKKLKLIYDENLTNRKIIGFVTSGGFLYHKSRQGGLGFILYQGLNTDSSDSSYVLIRKPSSSFYFLAEVVSTK